MTQLRQTRSAQSADMKQVKAFFVNNSVSVPLGCRIMNHLRATKTKSALYLTSADTIKALRCLPTDMRKELEFEVYQRILLTHPVFEAIQFVEFAALREIATS